MDVRRRRAPPERTEQRVNHLPGRGQPMANVAGSDGGGLAPGRYTENVVAGGPDSLRTRRPPSASASERANASPIPDRPEFETRRSKIRSGSPAIPRHASVPAPNAPERAPRASTVI